jgi:hypothetical protein
MRFKQCWPAVAVAAMCASTGAAQTPEYESASEFSLGVGYANVNLRHSEVIDNEGALRIDPSLTFSPIPQFPQLRIGGDVGVTMVLDNSSHAIISKNGSLTFIGSSDIPFWLVEPEASVSFRQPLGAHHEFFIEPGVAGGWAFGFLDLDAADSSGSSYHANDSTAFGRVFLRAGMEVTGGIAGLEVSWASGGNLDLGGNASGDLSEFYVGFFGALRF